MSGKILQIHFKFNISPAELAKSFAPLVEAIANLPGLRWKIWSFNEAEGEFAVTYLFEDTESAQAYLEGPLVAGIGQHPALSDIRAKQFDVLDAFTAKTRGPV